MFQPGWRVRIAFACPYAWDDPGGVQVHIRELAGRHASAWPRRGRARARSAERGRALGARGRTADRHHVQPVERTDRSAPVVGPARARRAPGVPTRCRPRARAVHAEHGDVGDARGGGARGRDVPHRRGAVPALRRRRAADPAARAPDRRAHRGIARGRAGARPPGSAGRSRSCRTARTSRRFADAEPAALGEGTKLLFVGRLDERKGFPVAVAAFGRLAADRPGLRLIVVGDGPERFATDVLPPAVRARSRCSAPCPTSTCPPFERACDVYLGTSIGGESFGIVLVEAMAAGLPVVASDMPGYDEVVTDGVEGLLVPPRDPAALAAAVGTILDDPGPGGAVRGGGPRARRHVRLERAGRQARGDLPAGGRQRPDTIGRDARRLDRRRGARGPGAAGPSSPTTGWCTLRNRVDNGWSQIDVQLRRRYDLIPNLVETVKGYAAHEREVFEHVTEARDAGDGRHRGRGPGARPRTRHGGARTADRGRRELPRPQGEPELPGAAGGADRHRVEDRLRAAVLQRPGGTPEHDDPDVPLEPHRRASATSSPGRSSTSRTRSADRCRSTSNPPCTSRSRRTSARPSCCWSSSFLLWRPIGYAIGLISGTGLGRRGDRRRARARALQIGAYFTGDRLVLASARAREVTPEEEPRLHNIVEGLAIAAGVPKPARVRRPRAGAERVRDRPRPGALVRRGHPGAAGDDEPRRARGGDRPRDVPRGRPRHPVRDDRRDRDRGHRLDLGVLPAELVVGRDRRAPERPRQRERGRRRADPVRRRVRAADPRAAVRTADPAGRVAEPRVPGRRAGRACSPGIRRA